jgi:Phasin protein
MSNKLLPRGDTLPALRAGLAFARDTREIATAWSRYHQDVMRHTSEASLALLRAGTFEELLEVQAKLQRAITQSFHEQMVKIAETTSRMATRPNDALKEATAEQAGTSFSG